MVSKLKLAFAFVCLTLFVGAWPSSGKYTPNCVTGCGVTHLYDNNNSGWNATETKLNTTTAANQLSLIGSNTALDEQVDAQPLLYNNSLYVVTENNTIYRLNQTTGAVIGSRNFGTPVPASVSGCANNSTVIGITSTPVIDTTSATIYFVTYTYPGSVPTYIIHGVDATTLADRVPPHTISVTATLSDATTYSFNATVSRQRAALKLGNGNIYVAFSSFCDFLPSTTRGWIMAFNRTTLLPAVVNGYLIDQIHPDIVDGAPYFLSSIWMAGAGPAIDALGNVYAATGNSGSNGAATTYNQTKNLSESIVKWTSTLQVSDYLSAFNLTTLDAADNDISASGVMLLPHLAGAVPNVLVQGAKDGTWRFVNRDNMGHFTGPAGPDLTITNVAGVGKCWCAPAQFIGADGIQRVVLPQGNSNGSASVYKVTPSPFAVTFERDLGATHLPQGQDAGFFTTVSSNQQIAGTAIVWLISRPTGAEPNNLPPNLFAFDPTNGNLLFNFIMNDWPNINGDLNAVPVINNGLVYVAGYKSVYILGFQPATTPATPIAYPVDIVASPTRCFLLTACSAAIKAAGTQKLVQVINSSTSETCDVIVSSVTGGWGNLANCSGAGGTGSATTYCTVNSCGVNLWYDQINNTFPIAPLSAAPLININCIGGLPCVTFVSAAFYSNTALRGGLQNPLSTAPYSISAMGYSTTSSTATFASGFAAKDWFAFNASGVMLLFGRGGPNQFRVNTNNANDSFGTMTDRQWHSVGILASASANASIVNIDGVETTGLLTTPATAGAEINIGNETGNKGDELITGLIFWPATTTMAQRNNVCHQYWQAQYGASNFGAAC